MEWEIITPNSFQQEDSKDSKCRIFLAGPTSGNLSWRSKLINDINNQVSIYLDKLTYYSPQWGYYKTDPHFYPMKFNEENQINWEFEHLSKSDIIVFGLFNPDDAGKENAWTNTHDYAQTTRYELGRYSAPSDMNSVIIYGEKGFKGLSYIKTMTEKSGRFRWYTERYDLFLNIIQNQIKEYISLKR